MDEIDDESSVSARFVKENSRPKQQQTTIADTLIYSAQKHLMVVARNGIVSHRNKSQPELVENID